VDQGHAGGGAGALTGHSDTVWELVSVKGWLISGSQDHGIRVWDVAMGCC
jgi:WD40 repeat protein